MVKKLVNAVGIIFESLDGRILTLLRSDKKSKVEERGTWGLVGGKIEPNELPSAAAIRETKEEINYDLNVLNLDYLKHFNWDRKDIIIDFHVFRTYVDKSFIPEISNGEHLTYEWNYPGDSYKKENLMKGLYDIIDKIYLK